MRERGRIVRGERQNNRAFAAQIHVDAACALQLFGKTRPARLAIAAERNQCFLAGLRLAAGSQHAGRRMACAGSGFAAIEHRNVGPRRQTPGDAEPDDAGADNGDARPLADMRFGCSRSVQRGFPSLE